MDEVYFSEVKVLADLKLCYWFWELIVLQIQYHAASQHLQDDFSFDAVCFTSLEGDGFFNDGDGIFDNPDSCIHHVLLIKNSSDEALVF